MRRNKFLKRGLVFLILGGAFYENPFHEGLYVYKLNFMYKYQIYLLADYLFRNLENPEIRRPEFRTALIAALLKSKKFFDDTLLDINTNNEYPINHRYRASLSKYPYEITKIGVISEGNRIHFTYTILCLDKDEDEHLKNSLSLQDFPDILIKRGVIDNVGIELLFSSLITSWLPNQPVIQDKFSACYDIINQLKVIYNQHKNDPEYKNFIETTLGAAIFYLPHGIDNWNKKISINALYNKVKKGRITKDHMFPRKRAANKVLSMEDNYQDYNYFKRDYQNQFAKYMILTPDENRLIVNYQKEFNNYEAALNHYKIRVFPEGDDCFCDHKELNRFCAFLRIPSKLDWKDYVLIQNKLDEFRNIENLG